MFLLDTNILSFNIYRPERFPTLVKNFRATKPRDRWISIVTAEEIIGGRFLRLYNLKRARRQQLLDAYYHLWDSIAVINHYSGKLKEFDDAAYEEFIGMPGEASGNDRRIAAIALSNNFTLVSHDRDFSLRLAAKPALRIQNWVTTDFSHINQRP